MHHPNMIMIMYLVVIHFFMIHLNYVIWDCLEVQHIGDIMMDNFGKMQWISITLDLGTKSIKLSINGFEIKSAIFLYLYIHEEVSSNISNISY